MPVHDWTRVRANRFHHFHQTWTPLIAAALNRGVLPAGYVALAEQITGGPEPDVVTLSVPGQHPVAPGGLALAEAPIKVHSSSAEASRYARKANRVHVYHPDGGVVAVIEVVSPGNKDSKHAIRSFARKAAEFLFAGIHLLIVDLFPPSKRDPQGMHRLIWDRIKDDDFHLPPDKSLTLASYASGTTISAYVEPVAVGDVLPDMPIFLSADRYVPCPLEATYQAAWEMFPSPLRGPLIAPTDGTHS